MTTLHTHRSNPTCKAGRIMFLALAACGGDVTADGARGDGGTHDARTARSRIEAGVTSADSTARMIDGGSHEAAPAVDAPGSFDSAIMETGSTDHQTLANGDAADGPETSRDASAADANYDIPDAAFAPCIDAGNIFAITTSGNVGTLTNGAHVLRVPGPLSPQYEDGYYVEVSTASGLIWGVMVRTPATGAPLSVGSYSVVPYPDGTSALLAVDGVNCVNPIGRVNIASMNATPGDQGILLSWLVAFNFSCGSGTAASGCVNFVYSE
jgi:hypothetical protein